MSLLIRGGRVVDPANRVDRQADVLIEDGRISRVDAGIGAADRVIDARDKLVVPGLIDLHVHLREPGEEHKETIESGSRAAVAGGFTTICCMPNTCPVNDTRAVTEYIQRRAREVDLLRVHPIGAVTRGLEGKVLAEFADMKAAGIVGVSDDGRCLLDSGLMRRALEYARTFGLTLIQHCEDHRLSAGGAINEGLVSTRAGLPAQPAQAESIIVGRDIELVELTGARYHAAHLSTAASLRYAREAKARGLPFSCEVTPHHFTLTDEACASYDTATKVNPPLRTAKDVDAIKQALADGTIDAIATDHAPHASIDKNVEYGLAAFGISGLETAVPLALELWRAKVIALDRLVALLTSGPAGVLGLAGGTLTVGAPGDVTVIDTDHSWVVRPDRFRSKGRNTPLAGREVKGQVTHTAVGGRLVYEAYPS